MEEKVPEGHPWSKDEQFLKMPVSLCMCKLGQEGNALFCFGLW